MKLLEENGIRYGQQYDADLCISSNLYDEEDIRTSYECGWNDSNFSMR